MNVLLVSAVIVVIDQITKAVTRSTMMLGESKPIIKNFFHFTYVTNDGMAFGLNFPGGIYFFSLVSLLMTFFLAWYFWQEKNYILMGRESDYYKNLEIALDRIDDGIFGICKICSELIPEERMLEVPNATKCVGCKEKEKLGLV